MKYNADYMRRAIALAKMAEGKTRPNPPVGAVVVRGGKIIGEGFHHRAGQPHAEVNAIADAKDAAGATIYVTLEPCSTSGRTPPCTDLLIRSGIAHVMIGCTDPNPKHAGRAFDILQAAGISVEICAECESECRGLIAPFASTVLRGRPHLTLKLAMTLDGCIADAAGSSRWITGEESRKIVHEWRARADAILIGAETLRADNPSLLAEGSEALRVVAAGKRPLPRDAKLFTDAFSPRTIISNGETLEEMLRRLTRDFGVMEVLCEGGGRLAASLIAAELVDRLALFYAPVIIGDERARRAFAGLTRSLAEAQNQRFKIVEQRKVGGDSLLIYENL